MTDILLKEFKAYSPLEVLRRIELFVQSRRQTELPLLTIYMENGVSLSGAFLAQSEDGHSLLLKGDVTSKSSTQTFYIDTAKIQCVKVHDVQPLAATLRGATIGRSSTDKAPSRLQLTRHIESAMQELSAKLGTTMTCSVDWAGPPSEVELLNVQDVFNAVHGALRTAAQDEMGSQAVRAFPVLTVHPVAKPLQLSKQQQTLVVSFDFSMPLPENYATVLSDELNSLL